MRALHMVDRVSLGALGLADVGAGIYLAAAHQGTILHVVVGMVAILLAFPAGAAALSGRLVRYSDEGVVVNVGVLIFLAGTHVFTPSGNPWRALGETVIFAAIILAASGLYFRLFGVLRTPRVGRRHRDD